MRKVVLVGLASTVLLTGCVGGNSIKDVPPLSMEEVAGNRLAQVTQDEREGLIYQMVSDSITVTSENLIALESRDLSRIEQLLSGVNKTLQGGQGKTPSGYPALSDDYANYMLLEFAKTPYQWVQSKVEPVGFDPASRLYFADVTYKTNMQYKTVVPSSKLPMGSPDEETLKQTRYVDYLALLQGRQSGEDVKALQTQFEQRWGKVSDILNEQQGKSLLERVRETPTPTIGALTYTGLIQDSSLNKGAEMTFRFVFKYRYNLGEETDLDVVSTYLKNYKMTGAESILANYDKPTPDGVEVLKPFVDRLILSYNKSVAESNSDGLYNVFADYGSTDKYYDDINRYTYNSIDGFNYKIIERTGTQMKVLVNRITKQRARGADMSLPTYDEKLLFTLVLTDEDKIKIRSVNLLDSVVVGEPMSVIKNVSGVSDRIQYSGESFTEENKVKVEDSLKNFMEVVFSGQVDTDEFSQVVDLGVSQPVLRKMSDTIVSVQDAERKVNYIVSYNTKTNVYTSVTVREVFFKGANSLDTEATIELVNRNGEWKVVNYTRTLSVKTAKANLDTKNALSEN